MEEVLMVLMGIGLAAACGFRVFVPLLLLSIASASGHVTLSPTFAWIGGTPALVMFASATALEIGAYYIPWLDNLLDSIATPAAAIAGTITTAAVVTNMSPELTWATAIIAGGGTATLIQSGTTLVRGGSTVLTAGIGNPLVSTGEGVFAFIMAVLAILVPIAAGIALLVIMFFVVRMLLRFRRRRAAEQTSDTHTVGSVSA